MTSVFFPGRTSLMLLIETKNKDVKKYRVSSSLANNNIYSFGQFEKEFNSIRIEFYQNSAQLSE
jgi:hypothetical protein